MDKNKILNKIKVMLGLVKDQFATAKLASGEEISFASLEINREVYDAEGNPLTAGEYILEDGTKITVDENGVIKEIEKEDGETEKEEVVEEMAEPTEEPTEETTEPVVEITIEDRVKSLEDGIDALKQEMDDLYNIVLTLTEKMQGSEAKVEETVAEFKKIKAQPSATPVHFGKEVSETPVSRIERLKELKALKQNQ